MSLKGKKQKNIFVYIPLWVNIKPLVLFHIKTIYKVQTFIIHNISYDSQNKNQSVVIASLLVSIKIFRLSV